MPAIATATPQTVHGTSSWPRMASLKHEPLETLLETASGVVKDTCAASTIFSKDKERKYPKFTAEEVIAGKVIGRGGFGVVKTVNQLKLLSKKESKKPKEERFTREYVAAQSKKKTRKGTPYVVKSVSADHPKITYMKGSVDIAIEAKFLAALDHPNIINLVAVSKAKPCTQGYFLVLERMTETLGARIKSWMDRDRQNKSIMGFLSGKDRELQLHREKIEASYDVANALHYLHSQNIIFRDLKPDNIGYDCHGMLKLFDFGLAKELLDSDRDVDGTYRNLTACTGAVRYMAPEVGLGRPYNLKADSYSWSMLMWFMLALEPPFGLYSNKMIFERVLRKGSRPAIFKRWSPAISETLKNCWDADIDKRPPLLEISLCMKRELIDCEANVAGGDTIASHSSQGEEHSD